VTALLEVEGLHAHYGKSHILHGVGFAIGVGEIVSLLGRNGSGRSRRIRFCFRRAAGVASSPTPTE
jgi:branched-chain amino acid transport system ATP-binding protein